MIAVAAWAWTLLGLLFVVVAGIVVMLLLGVAGTPGDFLRRLGQTATAPRSERGAPLPDEVPTTTPEETARAVEDDESER